MLVRVDLISYLTLTKIVIKPYCMLLTLLLFLSCHADQGWGGGREWQRVAFKRKELFIFGNQYTNDSTSNQRIRWTNYIRDKMWFINKDRIVQDVQYYEQRFRSLLGQRQAVHFAHRMKVECSQIFSGIPISKERTRYFIPSTLTFTFFSKRLQSCHILVTPLQYQLCFTLLLPSFIHFYE